MSSFIIIKLKSFLDSPNVSSLPVAEVLESTVVFVDGGRATVCVDSCVKVFVVVELDRISLGSIELGSSGI